MRIAILLLAVVACGGEVEPAMDSGTAGGSSLGDPHGSGMPNGSSSSSPGSPGEGGTEPFHVCPPLAPPAGEACDLAPPNNGCEYVSGRSCSAFVCSAKVWVSVGC